MNASTILKAVVAVTAVCTASAVAYTKIKEIKNKEAETPVDSDNEDDAELTVKEVAVIAAVSAVGGTAIGLVSLKYLPVFMYKGAVRELAERAINNGNLTFEQLIELSKPIKGGVVV